MVGRSWDNEWFQARMLDGQVGWIFGRHLVVWVDENQLAVTWEQPTQPPFARVESFALGGHVMDFTQGAFDIAQRAGMSWIKVQHRYYVGQSPQELASKIQSAHQRGFRILLGVVGDRAQLTDLNSYSASYAHFVAEVAALGADAIEIWNEPNIDREWPAGMIHGANYTQLLAASYTAIKARAPNTIVISAGPAPTGFSVPQAAAMAAATTTFSLSRWHTQARRITLIVWGCTITMGLSRRCKSAATRAVTTRRIISPGC